jgi:hypothetical protein
MPLIKLHELKIKFEVQVDEMTSWWNGKLIKWQVDKMASTNASWSNCILIKLQVDKMASWHNGKLAKWQVGEMASWRNGKLANGQLEKWQVKNDNFSNLRVDWKLTKWLVGILASWQNEPAPFSLANLTMALKTSILSTNFGQKVHFRPAHFPT